MQLEIIMGRDAEATPQTPIAEHAMLCGLGTGKTHLVNCIKQDAVKFGLSVMPCAYTGNAVDNLP
jgi:DNA replication protein DnaC